MSRALIIALTLAACGVDNTNQPDAGLPACATACNPLTISRLCTHEQVCACETTDGDKITCQGELPDAGQP